MSTKAGQAQVAEQSIDGLDLVLDARNAGEASTQLRQRELATE